MKVDVEVETLIARPRDVVSGFAGDDTLMRLRNRGAPSGFAKVAAPVMATAVRRATTKDLRRLKELLET